MASGGTSAIGAPGAGERRGAPRVAVGLAASLTRGRARAAGVVRDASPLGVLIQLAEPLLEHRGEAVLEIAFPEGGRRRIAAAQARSAAGPGGQVLVGLRLLGPPASAVLTGSPASGALPWPEAAHGARVRPRAVVAADLRQLGGVAYERALRAPSAPVPDPLVRWLRRVAAELGAPDPGAPPTARHLIDAVRALSRP